MILSVAVADIATDLYSVALPNIASYFNVKGNIAQLTISFNLVGLAISGLIYGPLSDHYGRGPNVGWYDNFYFSKRNMLLS